MYLYRLPELNSHYLISYSYDAIPLAFYDVNVWLMFIMLFPDYLTEIPLDLDSNNSILDIREYESNTDYIKRYLDNPTSMVDYIILKEKLMSPIPKDNTELYEKLCSENQGMVQQYKNGNIKVINQLLGMILKNNKTLNPQLIREELTTYLGNL